MADLAQIAARLTPKQRDALRLGGALAAAAVAKELGVPTATAIRLGQLLAQHAEKKAEFNRHGFMEGLKDEGIPMAGMVAGAYLGHRLLPAEMSTRTIAGSGIGYGLGALANLAADEYLKKKQKAATKTAGDSPAAFIPAAVGATLGAGVAGGLTKDEKNKARNMLAGSAVGYALGDVGLILGQHLLRKHAAAMPEGVAARMPGMVRPGRVGMVVPNRSAARPFSGNTMSAQNGAITGSKTANAGTALLGGAALTAAGVTAGRSLKSPTQEALSHLPLKTPLSQFAQDAQDFERPSFSVNPLGGRLRDALHRMRSSG